MERGKGYKLTHKDIVSLAIICNTCHACEIHENIYIASSYHAAGHKPPTPSLLPPGSWIDISNTPPVKQN
jgi:hypothetical protein